MGGLDFLGGGERTGGERGREGEGEGGLGGGAFRGGRRRGGKGGGSFFSHFGGRAGGVGRGGGGDWRWRLKGRGVWVVGLSFPRPFFGFLFRFLGFGVAPFSHFPIGVCLV